MAEQDVTLDFARVCGPVGQRGSLSASGRCAICCVCAGPGVDCGDWCGTWQARGGVFLRWYGTRLRCRNEEQEVERIGRALIIIYMELALRVGGIDYHGCTIRFIFFVLWRCIVGCRARGRGPDR